ncbi:unnamed protein product [Peronospora destructor]|uniref:Tetraspanin n=1 Tax=Peronospora destructor TaxID=86335 RepID=A0AAV0UBJ3_9STRA|nr:unnamed protein product [Peronospora destructor]
MPKLTKAGCMMILVNVCFLASGIMLLRYSSMLETSGWADALRSTDDDSFSHTATTMLQLLGFAVIALALVGIVGAIVQNRLLLLLYSIVMVIAMLAFGVLAGTAYTFNTKMAEWEDAPFPADDQETKVATTFNEVYCYAEGYYYCNTATVKETYVTFFPNASTELVNLLPDTKGVVSLCGKLDGAVEGLNTLCEACKMSTTFAKYEKVLLWAETKCPRSVVTGRWCALFLATGAAGEVYNDSPYGQCRIVFLEVAIDWSKTLATAGLAVAIAVAVLVALTCFARRSKDAKQSRPSKA